MKLVRRWEGSAYHHFMLSLSLAVLKPMSPVTENMLMCVVDGSKSYKP
jgi:hypothetical protein